MTTGWTHTRWMTALPDDIPISELGIPGTHNSAAINKTRSTRWACQDHSITEQLNLGIRLLDIRLKPKPRNRTEIDFEFKTCHGRLSLLGANEFQSFDDVRKECSDFLKENPGETIITTIKIDDWRRTRPDQHPLILQKLRDALASLPLLTVPHLPTLGECRGRIYLINRINDDPALGVPLAIPDNTPGAALAPTISRHYQVYVQDQYKALNYLNPEAHKLRLTLDAFKHKQPGAVLLNFASATKPVFRFVYIMRELIDQIGQTPGLQPSDLQPPRLQPSGWLFLDYALTTYPTDHHQALDLPTLLIATNFKQPATAPPTIDYA
jgi:hypothetical protein